MDGDERVGNDDFCSLQWRVARDLDDSSRQSAPGNGTAHSLYVPVVREDLTQ